MSASTRQWKRPSLPRDGIVLTQETDRDAFEIFGRYGSAREQVGGNLWWEHFVEKLSQFAGAFFDFLLERMDVVVHFLHHQVDDVVFDGSMLIEKWR